MVTVVSADDVAPQSWGNGGGTTRELACADDGSWRISLADIDAVGPFSTFPGRARLLTVVEGPVLRLEVDGTSQVVEPHRPFAFSGDATVVASVPEGAVRALNVITSAEIEPFVIVIELGPTSALPLAMDQSGLVLQGRARVDGTEVGAFSLVAGPTEISGRCTVAVITLQRPH